jgi:hypothetical protein
MGHLAPHFLALEQDAAFGRRQETGSDLQQGRFAAARGPDDTKKFTTGESEVDVIECTHTVGARRAENMRHVLDRQLR